MESSVWAWYVRQLKTAEPAIGCHGELLYLRSRALDSQPPWSAPHGTQAAISYYQYNRECARRNYHGELCLGLICEIVELAEILQSHAVTS